MKTDVAETKTITTEMMIGGGEMISEEGTTVAVLTWATDTTRKKW